MDGFKFAAMALSSATESTRSAELAPGIWTMPGKVGDLFEESQVAHWRGWRGSIEWDDLLECDRLVVVFTASKTAEVDDQENRALLQRVYWAKRALLLAGPNGLISGQTWFLAGQARGLSLGDGLMTIRNYEFGDPIVRPYYASFNSFWDQQPRHGHDDRWIDRWQEALTLLQTPPPPLLAYGLLAFARAFEDSEIEFKIPNCVRATEAIIGLPKSGGGQEAFADRVLAIVPSVAADPYVGSGARERLVSLYAHRNDCVHGKVPFHALQARKDGEEEAAKFDYLAELIARETLLAALRHPRARELFTDRTALERAWATPRFPS